MSSGGTGNVSDLSGGNERCSNRRFAQVMPAVAHLADQWADLLQESPALREDQDAKRAEHLQPDCTRVRYCRAIVHEEAGTDLTRAGDRAGLSRIQQPSVETFGIGTATDVAGGNCNGNSLRIRALRLCKALVQHRGRDLHIGKKAGQQIQQVQAPKRNPASSFGDDDRRAFSRNRRAPAPARQQWSG